MHKKAFVLLPAALLLLFAGCSQRPTPPEPELIDPPEPAVTVADGAVPGDESVSDAATDGMEGSYYNDYLRLTLTLDGCGNCTLLGLDTDAAGTYTQSSDGLLLDFGTRQETAVPDARGDITIDGRTGFFLRDWDFWGISESEAGTQAAVPGAGTETLMTPDGSFRYRDYGSHVACTCAEDMEILPDLLSDAVTVSDGNGAYVTGRNVTESLIQSNTPEAFLDGYITVFTIPDFRALYGISSEAITETEKQIFTDGTDGRLAAATLRLSDGDCDVAVSIILYTSVYADGTYNYICKSYFAPADDVGRLDTLADAVTDMSAVRMKPQS